MECTAEVEQREFHWLRCKKNLVKSRKQIERQKLDCDLSRLVIKTINKDIFDKTLNNYHYLGQSNKGHICRLGFFMDENTLIGVALITNPIRKVFDKTCEISRFCLCYDQPNLASKCISLIIKYLKNQLSNYEYVQAYSQNDIHLGTIYKASNFRECGSSKNSYNYDGIHKKTIYERAKSLGMSEHEYAQKFGLNRITEPSKTKFVYQLK